MKDYQAELMAWVRKHRVLIKSYTFGRNVLDPLNKNVFTI